MERFKSQRTAAITGSSSGIGLAITRRLISDGWAVIGIDIAPPKVEHAAFTAIHSDLASAGGVMDAAHSCLGVHALVHAAGFLRVAPIERLNTNDGESMWRLHVDAICRLASVVVPSMDRGGRVILLGSRISRGAAGRSYYSACKAALVALARSWALEVVERGITVNVISPAATDTGMLTDPARSTQVPKVPPLGRFIKPEEIAETVSFLLSPAADAITGQELLICGGASLAS
jgi:NAD(P)-dependent dehydrogenase (short-subunit alcohol dehydrogenase family)